MTILKLSLMKMTERQDTGSPFDCTSQFFITRTKLSEKIIRLRKLSQENHIRRMKLAYKMKAMSGDSGMSSCLSSSFPRKRFSNSKLSSVTPTTVQSCEGNIQPRKTRLFPLLPAKTNSETTRKNYPYSFKDNLEKKCTSVKIAKKRFFCTENKQNFSGGNFCHSLNKNKNMARSNDRLENNLQSDIKTFSNEKEELSLINNKDKKDRKKDEPLLKKSPTFVIDRNNVSEEEKRKISVAKKTPSKIPVLISRLKKRDQPKENISLSKQNTKEYSEETLDSMLELVENQFKQFNLQEAEEKEHESICFEESYTLPQVVCHCCEDNLCKCFYNTFCEEKGPHNEVSLIDKWMNGVVETNSGKNSNESSPISKFMRQTRTSPPQVIRSLVSLRGDDTLDHVNVDKGSRISPKYDYITDITESDESSGTYYDINEIAHKNSKKTDGPNRWDNENFEAESTITVPSDRDLEVDDHRDPIFKSLPDYPNTPYNLRYPRFRFKGYYDNIYKSLETESLNNVNQARSVKNRRKSYSATPKRVKSGKKKKIKKKTAREKDD